MIWATLRETGERSLAEVWRTWSWPGSPPPFFFVWKKKKWCYNLSVKEQMNQIGFLFHILSACCQGFNIYWANLCVCVFVFINMMPVCRDSLQGLWWDVSKCEVSRRVSRTCCAQEGANLISDIWLGWMLPDGGHEEKLILRRNKSESVFQLIPTFKHQHRLKLQTLCMNMKHHFSDSFVFPTTSTSDPRDVVFHLGVGALGFFKTSSSSFIETMVSTMTPCWLSVSDLTFLTHWAPYVGHVARTAGRSCLLCLMSWKYHSVFTASVFHSFVHRVCVCVFQP